MAQGSKIAVSAADKYLATYLDTEFVQDGVDVDTDPQLAHIAMFLTDRIASSPSGMIIDLGCGKGSLFQKLISIPQFYENPKWIYFGTDTEDNILSVQTLAIRAGINRRVDIRLLDDFYKSWPESTDKQIVVVRNVFHELTIHSTSQLIRHVANNAQPTDDFIVQDLEKLPQGERNNCCWVADELANAIKLHGFTTVNITSQATRSGNRWFNIACSGNNNSTLPEPESRKAIRAAREAQWEIWSDIDRPNSATDSSRAPLVEALDLDLQLAALTRQLRNEGSLSISLDPALEKRLRANALIRAIQNFASGPTLLQNSIAEYVHFRERGSQLFTLEEFLRDDGKCAIIYGGTGTGKTTLARHLLANRTYSKTSVILDGRKTSGVWALVESFLSQIGLNLQADILSVLSNLSFNSISTVLRQLLNSHGKNIVLFVDNFDQLIDSNGTFVSDETSEWFNILASDNRLKLILGCRQEFLPVTLQRTLGVAPVSIRLGRYGTDKTVVNVLDDHFDRAAAGISEYPQSLINAIDRHPLITTLAAQTLEKYGSGIVLDAQFLSELKMRLRNDLWNRLVDDKSRIAVEAAAGLRIEVPRRMMESLSSVDAVMQALEGELLYSIEDVRWGNLVSVLGLFRLKRPEDLLPNFSSSSVREEGTLDHGLVADLYWLNYKRDDDPKWIRESYYHRMLSGELDTEELANVAGKYYVGELIASADYTYVQRHDHKLALELYEAANTLGELGETSLMRRASCMIRVGKRADGEKEYKSLAERFPKNIGVKTSHIDALIFIQDYSAALAALEGYELGPDVSSWVAQQWGRIYLGLDRYEEAATIFQRVINTQDADPYSFVYLARALQQSGALGDAISVLRVGARRFKGNVAILTSLGADLERQRGTDVERQEFAREAKELLTPLLLTNPNNTRAALSLIRISLREGDVNSARSFLFTAEKNPGPGMEAFLAMAKSELWIADGRADLAADFLRSEMVKHPILVGSFLDAIYYWAESEPESERRTGILSDALKARVPIGLKNNMPVQVNLARVAALARDKSVFNRAIENLGRTRINIAELERLQDLWTELAT